MGNYASCALLGGRAAGNNKPSDAAAKVIFPNGEIRHFEEPTTAAELMMEIPNFFLINARSLRAGQRFSPLSADEELEMTNVYVMFPMKKVNSVVAASDLGPLYLAAISAAGNNNKVLPEPSSVAAAACSWQQLQEAKPKLNLEDMMEEFSTPEVTHRLSMTRSRKPSLDTIAEEPAAVPVPVVVIP